MLSTLIRRASPYRNSCRCFAVNVPTGMLPGTTAVKIRPYHPSALYPGTVMAPSARDLLSSTIWERSMSDTAPMPSHRGHIPPMRSNDTALRGPLPTFETPLA